jgi:hypothetical protein
MNQCPPGPQVFHWCRFDFFRKFAEIFANEYLSPVSLFSSVNDTGQKLFSGVNDTGEGHRRLILVRGNTQKA